MKVLKTASQSTEFIEKLYSMLEDVQNQPYIQWTGQGTSFLIINPTDFGRCMLNKHFKHGNLSSFVRQLNKYDFHKIKSQECILKQFGQQVWEFKHNYFQRGRDDMLKHIVRKKSNADKRFKTSREMSSDNLEASNRIQSQIIGTLKMLTVHFQVLVEEVNDLKRNLSKKDVLFKENVSALVAEDNVTCSSYAGAILRKIGCSADIIEQEKDILVKLSETKYDIVFLSLQIPSIQKILSAFRQYDEITPVILTIDGLAQEEYISVLGAGANDILVKPYHQNAMVQLMMKYCYNQRTNAPIHTKPISNNLSIW
ncbi:hypothetical protein NEPAR06_1315 [Nematocida parisii]|uniref:Response regulatory domain-containing protein n=1 Tax=Nematocida parisii (strain ERTm3) TaxID=935791 RepID=I3EEC6_NEMP3|nr:uncharacterized protein NEPG_02199 [Nematocida parisii ERTm1]EIJ87573.1 hypothetical protein NEQG_02120 [Nematocida parisii ERTm3]KAI5129093.1 hypothetical protein NEPAR08_1473 [Nematocida parisii]EIJ92800.1 hypothetical protein NEPG_02199 [Nematocida parisii ERTm1]KAI5129124.1 hypothetical protein NEPAR03_1528 [Nematocida parisii]KAI5141932.1 hypothetical protein NEPAR04_1300 [Nematocida parisii]|eukprot:XP_013060026.1 hypothetical protein NEPG_02199 [Nematocida parisii ERTm1]